MLITDSHNSSDYDGRLMNELPEGYGEAHETESSEVI